MASNITKQIAENLTADTEARALIAYIAGPPDQARATTEKEHRAQTQGRRAAPPGSLEHRYLHAKSELLRVTADYAHAHGIDVSAARKELEAIAAAAGDPT